MRALGISRSTLSDLLAALRGLGYLQDHDRRWAPGPRLVTLVHRGMAQQTALLSGIHPVLERLAGASGETAAYVIRVGETTIAVDQAPSPNPIRFVATIGEPFPIEVTTPGIVFRAFDPDEPPELEHVRRRGYAVQDRGPGRSAGIAAPVRSPAGLVIGTIGVVGPPERLRDAETRIWPLLRSAVAELFPPDYPDD